MRIVLAFLLILGFAGIAVFGIFAMNDNGAHSGGKCIAAMAQGGNCPGERGMEPMFVFHVDAFRGFSTAVFGNSFVTALILLSGLVLLAIFGFRGVVRQTALKLAANCRHLRSEDVSSHYIRRKFAFWLARHENSPQFFVWRAG